MSIKPFEISTDSWHYRFVSRISGDLPSDICAYTRMFIFGVIGAACLLLALGLCLYAAVHGVVWLVWMLVNLEFITPDTLAPAGILLLLFAGVIAFLAYKEDREIPVPSFLSAAYESFHDKFCIPLEFK